MSGLLGAMTREQRSSALGGSTEVKSFDRSILFLRQLGAGSKVIRLVKKKAQTLPSDEWVTFKARIIERLSKDL